MSPTLISLLVMLVILVIAIWVISIIPLPPSAVIVRTILYVALGVAVIIYLWRYLPR